MPSTVVVTGANGFVGARVCEALAERGVQVRAIVRRASTAPDLSQVTEIVGDFADPELAASALAGASAAVTTVHPMESDLETQKRVGVDGTVAFARAAAAAGVQRLIHVSTAAVYDRSPGVGDVDESSALVPDDTNDYSLTKRDGDLALAEVAGITRVLLRPPAILGPGPTSTWNTLVPDEMRSDQDSRRANPDRTFAWVHVADLASLATELALGGIADAADAADGPLAGGCVAVNVTASRATQRDYVGAVTAALGLDPVWDDEPGWTGTLLADRARAWGWTPAFELAQALDELAAGLRTP
jgi:2-alkyl-3-oxoalkanoate reductase